MAKISLEGMQFYAYHGCFEEERRVGTRFEVSCLLEYESSEAENEDNLSKAVDYQELYSVIKQEMAVPSALLEHVAHRILAAIKTKFPHVGPVEVKVSKMQPPLGGNIDRVSVILKAE